MTEIPVIPKSGGAITNRVSISLLGGGFLALSLFTFLPNSYGLMVQWPWVVLWQLGMVAIALWTLWQLRQFGQPFPLLGHHLDWAMALSLLSLTLSTLFAYQPQASVWYLVMAAGYGVILYALNIWLSREQFLTKEAEGEADNFTTSAAFPNSGLSQRSWWLLNWLGLCAVVTSAVSLIYWWLNRATIAASIEPVNPYPLGHHNFVAGYMVLMLPVLIALAWEQRGWKRWLWAAGGVMALLAIYGTGSRGGVLGLFSLLPVVAIVIWLRSSRQKRRRFAVIAGLSILFLGAIALSNPRVQRLITTALQGRVEGNALFRLFTIEAGLKIWQDYPWLGIGPGNTIKLYDLYRPIEAATVAFRVQQLHNTPVNLLAELGILGFGVYLLWLALLLWLVWRLFRLPWESSQEQAALYGCSAGLFAYTVSSLTDYQLENIGISLTLVSFIAILANLAHKFKSPPLLEVTRWRRYLSLLGFVLVLAAFPVWVPVDAAMMLARSGTADIEQGYVTGFYNQWTTAAKLVPNDPYYEFQIGAQLAELVETSKSSPVVSNTDENQEQYRQYLLARAGASLQRAVQLVPTDELFNRYLGAFLVIYEPEQAVKYLRRAAQLTPRKTYTYAMIGDAYLKASNPEKASKAFAIEGFINPTFFTLPAWQEPSFKKIWQESVSQTIQLYREALGKMSPNQPEYNQVYQNMVMLQWLSAKVPPDKFEAMVEMQRLSPTAQALILIDAKKTDAALSRLSDQSPGSLLLKAWIAPKENLAKVSQSKLAPLAQTIPAYREVRPWLSSLPSRTKSISSRIGFFSYRNTNGADTVEIPRSFPTNPLVNNLGIFSEIGILPVFDQTLVAAQKRLLNLNRPLQAS